MWKVSRRTVYEWIKTGRIQAYKLGDTVRIPASVLAQFLKPIEPPPPALSKPKPEKRATREKGNRSLDDLVSKLRLYLRPQLGKIRAAEFGTKDITALTAVRLKSSFSV